MVESLLEGLPEGAKPLFVGTSTMCVTHPDGTKDLYDVVGSRQTYYGNRILRYEFDKTLDSTNKIFS